MPFSYVHHVVFFPPLHGALYQHAEELKYVLEQIKKEDNLGPGQEQEIIWLLWQRKHELAQQLKDWELGLDEIKVDPGNIRESLKVTGVGLRERTP